MARGRAPNGSGTVRLRKDGRWEAIYTIGTDLGTGNLKRKHTYHKTEEEARIALRAATAAIDAKTYVEPEKMLLIPFSN